MLSSIYTHEKLAWGKLWYVYDPGERKPIGFGFGFGCKLDLISPKLGPKGFGFGFGCILDLIWQKLRPKGFSVANWIKFGENLGQIDPFLSLLKTLTESHDSHQIR